MLEYFVLALAAFSRPVRADEVGFYIAPNNTVECANDLVKWCDGMKYPQEGAGMSMASVNIADSRGFIRVLCTADSDGTNCTKNGSPWFACSSKDNKFYYKGKQLREGSDEGTDDDMCNTAKRAFNDLMVQGLTYDNETMKNAMEKGMESFFKQMAAMQRQIEELNKKIMTMFGNNFPFWNGDSSSYGNNFPFWNGDSSSDGESSSSEEDSFTEINQRETV